MSIMRVSSLTNKQTNTPNGHQQKTESLFFLFDAGWWVGVGSFSVKKKKSWSSLDFSTARVIWAVRPTSFFFFFFFFVLCGLDAAVKEDLP